MPYSDREFKVSNVNYVNKDFSSLKNTLMEYAKTYYPNTYKDFNETSPGMMLIEMSAYVGDVLSFYIDNQYKEMMLPLAEERRNLIHIANMMGYKVKPTSPSYVDISVSQNVSTAGSVNDIQPDYSDAMAIDRGMVLASSTNSTITFITLDSVDFTVSSSAFPPEPSSFDANGVVTEYKLTRKVKAMSAEEKTKTVTVGSPVKFYEIKLAESNVIDIVSVVDGNGNTWYEVDYLVQDKIPTEVHYSDGSNSRATAYDDVTGNVVMEVPVPYTLQYIRTSKRFITRTNDDDTVSLIFGNGILRNGQLQGSDLVQTEQLGVMVPGSTPDSNLITYIDSLAGDSKSTLGETPSNTNLTVTYRIGGGITSNVISGDIVTINSHTLLVDGNESTPTVTNDLPSTGGSSGETIEEIRTNTQGFFTTQNRCVTQGDFEARILNMPAKFGNLAKVLVERRSFNELFTDVASYDQVDVDDSTISETEFENLYSGQISTIDAYLLSYDGNKNLTSTNDLINTNLKEYLDQYRMITDEISLKDGHIVNFGVAFEVVSHKASNKQDVKLRCINKIIEYFSIDKLQFRQPLYISDLEYELMGIEGVRSVNWVELTQNFNDGGLSDGHSIGISGTTALYDFDTNSVGGSAQGGTSGYGWKYDFINFYNGTIPSSGVILPSMTPSVFELKNPNQNVKGVVR